MKCKTCQKKITLEHFYGSTGGGSKAGKILLVLKCQCGVYTIPFDLVRVSRGKGLVSSRPYPHESPMTAILIRNCPSV